MPTPPPRRRRRALRDWASDPTHPARTAALVSGLYFIASSAYILLSGRYAATISPTIDRLLAVEWVKGLAYSAVVALGLFALTRFLLARILAQGEERRIQERRFRAVFESAAMGTALVDGAGRILEANTTLGRMLGYSPEELRARTVGDLTHPDDRPDAMALWNEISASDREAYRMEKRCVRKDGTVFWGRLHVSVVARPATAGFTAITMVEDISDFRAAMDNLRKSGERFRALVESSVDIVTMVDQQGTILLMSPSVQPTLDYAPEALVGRNAFELIHPDDADAVRAALERAFATPGTPEHLEFRFRHRDGSWRVLESTGRSMLESGAPGSAVVTSRDITDQRELEAQMRQAQKMDAIGGLAGGIAHDFNNLLAVILTYCGFLADAVQDEAAREDVEEIRRAAERATSLTRQLLAFSRRQMQQLTVLDLNEVLGDLHSMLRRLITEDIELDIRCGESLPLIKADRSQMEQIILNLAVNARDAMPQGGRLTIETGPAAPGDPRLEPFRGTAGRRFARLTMTDTGVGMDEATRNRVFEPFFTTKEVNKGTGLGLSTVYGIVKQHDGFVTVESAPGQGATFALFLPVTDEEAGADRLTNRKLEALRGWETVLVVEDNDSVRAAAGRILSKHGYRVLSAADGPEALEVCRAETAPIHLLLTDVVMPQMSGSALAEEARKLVLGLRVLYMSGYTDNIIDPHGVLAPGVRLLEKPFTQQGLVAAVRQALDESG